MSIHVNANATPYVRRSEHNTDSMVIGLGLGGHRSVNYKTEQPAKCHVQGHFGSGSVGLVQSLLFQMASGCTGLYPSQFVRKCENNVVPVLAQWLRCRTMFTTSNRVATKIACTAAMAAFASNKSSNKLLNIDVIDKQYTFWSHVPSCTQATGHLTKPYKIHSH